MRVEVAKVKINRDYEIGGSVYFKGSEFFISQLHRAKGSTRDICTVYDSHGCRIGIIYGYYFDYAGGDLFEKVESQIDKQQ